MTQTISVKGGSVAIIPYSTVAEDGDISVDEDSVLIIWDDEDESIGSVKDAINQAMLNQAARQSAVSIRREGVEIYTPRPPGEQPKDLDGAQPPGYSPKLTAPVHTRRERGE